MSSEKNTILTYLFKVLFFMYPVLFYSYIDNVFTFQVWISWLALNSIIVFKSNLKLLLRSLFWFVFLFIFTPYIYSSFAHFQMRSFVFYSSICAVFIASLLTSLKKIDAVWIPAFFFACFSYAFTALVFPIADLVLNTNNQYTLQTSFSENKKEIAK